MNVSYVKKIFYFIFRQKILLFLIGLSWASETAMIYAMDQGGFKLHNVYAFYYQVAIFCVLFVNSSVVLGGPETSIWKILKSNYIPLGQILISRYFVIFAVNLIIGLLMFVPIICAPLVMETSQLLHVSVLEVIKGSLTYGIVGLFYASIVSIFVPFIKKLSNVYLFSLVVFFLIPYATFSDINLFFMSEIMFNRMSYLQLLLIAALSLVSVVVALKTWNHKEYS